MTTTGDVDLVFLVVRRKKRSIFLEAPSTTNVAEVKKMLEGIIKVPPYNQRLYLNMHGDEEMEDDKDLAFYGINATVSKPASPVYLGLCIKIEDGSFEPMLVIPYSVPPEFTDVMKMDPAVQNTEQMETSAIATPNEDLPSVPLNQE